MKVYETTYNIQNLADLEYRLSEEFGEPEKTDQEKVFNSTFSNDFRKEYIYRENNQELVEKGHSSYYPILTFFLSIIFIFYINITSYGIVLFSVLYGLIVSLAGLLTFSYPLLHMKRQPEVFYIDNNVLQNFKSVLPILFRRDVRVSKVVYFNGILTLIVAVPLIMPAFSITLIAPLVLLTVSLPLVGRSTQNPATMHLQQLAAISTWPFGITLSNLEMYAQHSAFLQQELSFLSAIEQTLLNSNQIGISTSWVLTSRITRLLLVNSAIVIILWYLIPRYLNRVAESEGVYQSTPLVTKQIFLRTGMVFLLSAYLFIPFIILLSLVLGVPLIDIKSLVDLSVLYTPVILVIPLAVIGWIHNTHQKRSRTRKIIESHSPHLCVNKIPVLTADIGQSAAFLTRPIDDQRYIIVNQELADKLNTEELLAICHHESFHLHNKTHRIQKMSGLPIVGYLLFFAFVSPVSIHEEEFKADEHAAQKVSNEAIASVIEKTDSMNLGPSSSPIKRLLNHSGWWVGIRILWDTPILQVYRPERRVRLARLQ